MCSAGDTLASMEDAAHGLMQLNAAQALLHSLEHCISNEVHKSIMNSGLSVDKPTHQACWRAGWLIRSKARHCAMLATCHDSWVILSSIQADFTDQQHK